MNEYRLALENALARARTGREAEALEQLASVLNLAVVDGSLPWVSLLARNAAILSERIGDQRRAVDFLRLSLAHFPNDARVLGRLYLLQGDLDLAQQQFASCRTVCHNDHVEGYQEIIELLDQLESR